MKTRRDKTTLEIISLIFRETFKSFQSNSNFEVSAALATYGFFAFLPLLFFLGYLFGNFPVFSKKLGHGIDHLIFLMFPRTERLITQDLYFFTAHKVTWAIIGLSLVVVSVMSLTGTLRSAFHRTFRHIPAASVLQAQLANLKAAVIMVLLFIFLIFSGTLFLHFLGNLFPRGNILSEIIPGFAGGILFMMVLYKTFLPLSLDSRRLLIASLLSAVLFVLMREIFSAFLQYNPGFGEAFGALRTLFIMATWVYYCFLVILFGAELMVNIGKKEALLLKNLFLSVGDSPQNIGPWMSRFVQEYDPGQVVFEQGEKGDRMFYILSGSVKVMGDQGIIRLMKEGEYFGEMSMLLDSPRSATITVSEEGARLIVLSRKNFEVILRDNPEIVFSILKEMSGRLKDITSRVL
jgi:membrane protein